MHATKETIGPLTRDPMCGRQIARAQALLSAEHHGRTHLFCSERCRMLFALRPDSFAVDGVQPAAEEEAHEQ
jgi:YHS domain-containing protein